VSDQIADLLLTPTAVYGGGTPDGHLARKSNTFDDSTRTNVTDLRMVVEYLPTPTAVQGRNATSGRQDNAQFNSGTTLGDVVYNLPTEQAHAALIDRYGPAIDRHAWLIDRRPPSPIILNPKSRTGVSLNPVFVEWMMCLPDGHVTDVPMARTNHLKILGNGVVPAQAVAAYTELFQRFEVRT